MPASYRVEIPVPARVVVLVSGSGTLLQALLDAAAKPDYPARVVGVAADRTGIEGLARAERAGIPTFHLRSPNSPTAQAGTPRSPRPWPDTSPTSSSAPGS